ncbi:MAG: tyrosine-type recombinase/integrase, partial [Acidobacteria bacterium]|nr:tyrosine-type recombinase/integrase [Acidobacteriota bacterium]
MVSAPKEQKGRALAPEEIRALLEACVDDAYPIVATAVLTGMRRGEVFGLRWSDVDFDSNQIHVRQSLYWMRGKNRQPDQPVFAFLAPKSRASI